jgi:hypothetical protein
MAREEQEPHAATVPGAPAEDAADQPTIAGKACGRWRLGSLDIAAEVHQRFHGFGDEGRGLA